MRHPKNPFSPGEPDGDAFDRPRDRHELAADAAPGRGSGTPPPLPRRTGDSGFQPRAGHAPPQQDFWPLTDPEDSWPLAPRPPAEPAGCWSPADPEGSWVAPAPEARAASGPAQRGPRDDGAQADPRDDWAPAGPEEPWAAYGPAPSGPRDDGAQADPRDDWAQADPEEPWAAYGPAQSGPRDDGAQADPRDDWAQADPEEPWAAYGPAEGNPPDSRGRGGGQESCSPDSRPHGAPRDPWRPPPAREDPRGEDLRGPDRGAEPPPAAAAGAAPDQEGDPAPASMGFQDLRESWEPPYDPIGAISEPVRYPTAPYPELVRDAEYEDDLGFWDTEAAAGSGGGPHYPDYPGPRHRAQHARNPGRPRLSGALLALAGALAIAGAIPLGILGVRTLAGHGNPALRTAPLSASHAVAAAPGPNGGGTFTAIAGPGCPAATGASVFPYHPVNGDDWFPGTASASGPCGRSFSYVYLAMVPGNPGEWRDHYAWIFHTGMDNPSCTFSLYIPAAPQANSTGYYWFSAGEGNAAGRIADFTIDQATHQGQWVTKGPFTFPGGTVLIEATDRGEGALTASVAVGPVRLSC